MSYELSSDQPLVSCARDAHRSRGDFAFAALLIDSPILIVEARIHLGAAGMSLVPGLSVRESGGAGDDAEGKDDNGNARTTRDGKHRVLPSAGRVLIHPTPEPCRGAR